MEKERYRVGELAHLCGVNRRTIDFYTQAGLLSPIARSSGGHRFYGAGAVGRVRLIKALQGEGLQLDAIRKRLADGGWGADMLASIAQLQGELRRMEDEVAALRHRLATADATRRAVIHAALASVAAYALGLSQELAELLGQTGIGPF